MAEFLVPNPGCCYRIMDLSCKVRTLRVLEFEKRQRVDFFFRFRKRFIYKILVDLVPIRAMGKKQDEIDGLWSSHHF